MKPTKITQKYGNRTETMMVSVNCQEKTATIVTYDNDGDRCGKYRVDLEQEDVRYYDGCTSYNDWKQLLRLGYMVW